MGIKFFCLRIDVRIENITVFSESWSSFPFNVIFQNATNDFESVFNVFCDGGRFFRAPFNLTASSQQNQIGRAELTDKSCSWQRCKLWTSVYVDNQG